MHISKQDLQYIEQQLGRKPEGVIEISVRTKDGRPLVIVTKPLINNEVFPTLYYLVDNNLIQKVSRLESEGCLAQLQERVEKDESFRKSFLQAQQSYNKKRNAFLGFNKISQSQKEALETGIGGVKDYTRVKCLHCHLAHYLATSDNPVGKEVSNMLALPLIHNPLP